MAEKADMGQFGNKFTSIEAEGGTMRYNGGRNPGEHGQLSEDYIFGVAHIIEGVKQIRGTAINQATTPSSRSPEGLHTCQVTGRFAQGSDICD